MQRILVVEDDFDIQELLQNFLQEAGYEVAVAMMVSRRYLYLRESDMT